MVTGALIRAKALCGSTSGRPAGACDGVGEARPLPDSASFRVAAGERRQQAPIRSGGREQRAARNVAVGTSSALERAASAARYRSHRAVKTK